MKIPKEALSWAFYDWGNSAFATVVVAGLFPLFFSNYWGSSLPSVEPVFWLTLATSVSSGVVLVLAPILGAWADIRHSQKRWLFSCVGFGIIATVLLTPLGEGKWQLAALCYTIALIGFGGGNVFYDALLRSASHRYGIHRTSSLGFSLGYAGGGLLFAIVVGFITFPQLLGMSSTAIIRLSFVVTGVWWGLATIPLLVNVTDVGGDGIASAASRYTVGEVARRTLSSLVATFKSVRQQRNLFLFLVAYWFYIDGVDTIVRVAVIYGAQLNIGQQTLIMALLLTQAVGFPSTLLYYRFGKKIGYKQAILVAILVYMIITVSAFFLAQAWHFFALAVAVGLVQGGIQALSRSLYGTLIPPDEVGKYFGFYNMLGRLAAVIGPLLLGVTTRLTENVRIGVLAILLLFVVGFVLLTRVRVESTTT